MADRKVTCCDPDPTHPLDRIDAGLDTLPRQLRTFAEVRRDLLDAVPNKPQLSGWAPRPGDLGLMWLEMWAYVSDVLGFYDARVADASYLRTAPDRSALRRLVAVLGYAPAAGVAGTAQLAVIAKGREAVRLPLGTPFRSRAFEGQPPQVFTADADVVVHPLRNRWTVAPFAPGPRATAEVGVERMLFEPRGFGLAVGDPVTFEAKDPAGPPAPVSPATTSVVATRPVRTADGASYVEVTLRPPVDIAAGVDLAGLRARKPTRMALPSARALAGISAGDSAGPNRFYVEGPSPRLAEGAPVLVGSGHGTAGAAYLTRALSGSAPAELLVKQVALPDPPGGAVAQTVPATRIDLSAAQAGEPFAAQGAGRTLHFGFVEAGQPTAPRRVDVDVDVLTRPEGVPIDGFVQLPSSDDGVLEQDFLYADARGRGGRLSGRLEVDASARARFVALDPSEVPAAPLALPLTLYGNVVSSTRGERVTREVLGSGDPRTPGQRFELAKRPLTYLPSAGAPSGVASLELYVDGRRWREVKSFLGCGPEAEVYVLEHDEAQRTRVVTGDGVRGRRVPAGVGNVVASYRFGAGAAAPPAGGITQVSRPPHGVHGVLSPAAALPGKDPERAEDVRRDAPTRALMLDRAVSLADYEALARAAAGVIAVTAEWAWLEAQMQAGVQIAYIGDPDAATLRANLIAVADPTIPIAIVRADPIAVELSLEVEVDPRYVAEDVAAAVVEHLLAPQVGLLSPTRATIGGTFWASRLYAAALEVPGVLSVRAATFVTPPSGPTISDTGGTCVPSASWLDFTGPGAVHAEGVAPSGPVPEPPDGGQA